MSSIYDWSTTSANNANADAAINWAEGQAPSTVNNSARVMMQRIKELLNDLGGVANTTGSANNIAVATSSPFTAYQDGLRVSFRATQSNTAVTTTTLNVNSIGAKVMLCIIDGEMANVIGGHIIENGIYECVYDEGLDGGSGGWFLLNPSQRVTDDPGFIKAWGGVNVPDGYLECNGATVSRTTYAGLFGAIGTTWGAGNGSTTFKIPDFRGEFLRGWDHGKGTDAGRAFASSQVDELKSHTHTGSTGNSAPNLNGFTDIDGAQTGGGGSRVAASSGGTAVPVSAHNHTVTINATGGTETRPRNVAVMYVIKT